MSATRYAHSIKKHRIIKFPGKRGQLIRPDTSPSGCGSSMPPSTTPDICTHAFDKKAASAGLQGMPEI